MEGIFRGRAKSWALCEASTGTPQIAVAFETQMPDGPKVRTWYGFLSEAAFERTIEGLRNAGWTGDDLANIESLDQEVDLVFEDETDQQGVIRERIRWVNKVGGLAIKAPMPAEKAKSFAASMRGRIRAIDAAKGVRKPSTAPTPSLAAPPSVGPKGNEPPPFTDDDIPF